MKGTMKICRTCGRRFKPVPRRRNLDCPRCLGICTCCGERVPWLAKDQQLAREMDA